VEPGKKVILQKTKVNDAFFHKEAVLPYGLKIEEIRQAIIDTYEFLDKINSFLLENGYLRLEELLLGNALSGFLSEVIVKSISNNSKKITRNKKVGGHPDLIQVGAYQNNSVLLGKDGIEIKTSKQRGGWQGHNPEEGYLIVFRYILDESERPAVEKTPIEFVQVLCAQLALNDWSFSGRVGKSRRTITASITKSGMLKLRSNPVYQHSDYIVGKKSSSRNQTVLE
jgi:hypothetical protein